MGGGLKSLHTVISSQTGRPLSFVYFIDFSRASYQESCNLVCRKKKLDFFLNHILYSILLNDVVIPPLSPGNSAGTILSLKNFIVRQFHKIINLLKLKN